MDNNVRLCYPQLLECARCHIQPVLSYDMRPWFTGFLGSFGDGFLDIFWQPSFNYTMVKAESTNFEDKDGRPGCNGLLLQNRSDAGIYPNSYPSYHDDLDVRDICSERKFHIFSFYNLTKSDMRDMDILESFKSLSLDVWVMFFLTSMVIIAMITMVSSQKYKMLDILVVYFFRQGSFEFHKWSSRYLSTLLSLMIFFVTLYYFNLMSTDLVVVEKPDIFDSYDDITAKIDRVTPKFYHAVGVPYDFTHAAAGSKERYIWERIRQRDHLTNPTYVNRMYEQMSGKTVEILDSEFSTVVLALICAYKVKFRETFDGHFPYISKETSDKKTQFGLIFRRGANYRYQKLVTKRHGKLFEGGLYQTMILHLMKTAEGRMDDGRSRLDFLNCISRKLQIPDAGIHDLTVTPFRCLMYVIALVVCVGWGILAVEVLVTSWLRG